MKLTSKLFKLSILATVILGATIPAAQAGRLSGKIDYQTYLDFAANRGAFKVGATDIAVQGHDGTVYGTIKVPMVDWSATDPSGIATLINPQYAVSAAHNQGYSGANYGGQHYGFVSRHDSWSDFHVRRANKVVTEVAPFGLVEGVINHLKEDSQYFQKGRYTTFLRAGSGTHEYITYDQDGKATNNWIMGAYSVLTGGTMPALNGYANGDYINSRTAEQLDPSGDNFLPTHPRAGDSGSPLVGYDTLNKQWVVLGVTSTVTSVGSNYATVNDWFVNKIIQDDTDAPVALNGGKGTWTFDSEKGVGSIAVGGQKYDMHGQVGNNADAGKHLTFNGGGTLELAQNVDQGAGALTFNGNYTVQSQGDAQATWKGAGIILGNGANVTWKVNGVEGDTMHVIGNGTLTIQGQGVNAGALKVGQGTVILDQQADSEGHRQAFSALNINSGRATVVLKTADQVNPDNISWGFRGGTLDVNGNDLTFHKINQADEGAILDNKSDHRATIRLDYNKVADSGLDFNSAVLYHGQIKGNLNVINRVDPAWTEPLAIDGSVQIKGDFEQENGTLLLQGHPEIHAYVSQTIADKINAISGQKVNTQPTNFDQTDWQTRFFSVNNLKLTGVDFGLGRNAVLAANIDANRSAVNLGDERVFLDLFDGNVNKQLYMQGQSSHVDDKDIAFFQGSVNAYNGSVVNVKGRFFGDLTAQDSEVNLNSKYINFINASFKNTKLTVADGSTIAVNHRFESDAPVTLENGLLSLSTPSTQAAVDAQKGQTAKVNAGYYAAPSWKLAGDKSRVNVGAYGVLMGDVNVDAHGSLNFDGSGQLQNPTNDIDQQSVAMLNGYEHAWRGAINGDWATAHVNKTYWLVTGNSSLDTLEASGSLIAFRNGHDTTAGTLWNKFDDRKTLTPEFSTLKVANLTLQDANLYVRTNGEKYDHIEVTNRLSGGHNTLYIDNIKPVEGPTITNLDVLTVKGDLPSDFIQVGTSKVGFTTITPEVQVQKNGDKSSLVVTGLNTQIDHASAAAAGDVLGMGYQGFVSEINNMNLRMGELRDNPFSSGVWARVTNAAGSSSTSSNEWSAIQTGADKQLRTGNANVYVGGLLTYTHTDTTGNTYNAKGDAYGVGVYASTVFDSGLYLDTIAKYIRTGTDYNLNYAGSTQTTLHNNTLYAGAEVGYRYHVTPTTFLEPQAELVLGHLGEQDFAWSDGKQMLRMHQDASTPLVGRTGLVFGKHFEGEGWKLDARLGAHYEFDIVPTDAVLLTDGLATHSLESERDGRFIYAVGVNAQVRDNVRLGLELQRSAGGRYDIGHLVNATVRYSF